MQIFFKKRKIEFLEDENFMARRLGGLNKFLSENAYIYVDVEQTRSSNNGDDLFYVSIKIEDGKYRYFTDEYQSSIRKAFDYAYGDIYRIVRNDRSKSRRMLRTAGRAFKRIVRR